METSNLSTYELSLKLYNEGKSFFDIELYLENQNLNNYEIEELITKLKKEVGIANEDIFNNNEDEFYDLKKHKFESATKKIIDINEKYKQQNFKLAIITGVFASIVTALLWSFISINIEEQYGVFSIAVGYVVGNTIQLFGKGLLIKYSILGAILSLFGSVLGNAIILLNILNTSNEYSLLELVSLLFSENFYYIFGVTTSKIDIVFYILSAIFGYKYSRIKI